LIGINYIGTQDQLNGCINDVNNLSSYLKEVGFSPSNITVLTDYTPVKPTKANILAAIQKLIKNAVAGDEIVLHYSGHGSNTFASTPMHAEYICPIDSVLNGRNVSTKNFIKDAELNAAIRDQLKPGVNMLAIFDCCFSGTILDLGYEYYKKGISDTSFTRVSSNPDTQGKLILISGSNDNQTSADLLAENTYQGAMTYALLKSFKIGYDFNTGIQFQRDITYADLITNIRKILKGLDGVTQIPQISCGNATDIKTVSVKL